MTDNTVSEYHFFFLPFFTSFFRLMSNTACSLHFSQPAVVFLSFKMVNLFLVITGTLWQVVCTYLASTSVETLPGTFLRISSPKVTNSLSMVLATCSSSVLSSKRNITKLVISVAEVHWNCVAVILKASILYFCTLKLLEIWQIIRLKLFEALLLK